MSVQWTTVLILMAVIAVFTLQHILSRARDERRREHMERLATKLGGALEQIDEWTLRLVTVLDGRELEILQGYRGGGGTGSSATAGRYVTFTTTLRGRSWDLHDVRIRPRRGTSPVFEDRFAVEQFGLPLPDRWLTDAVRAALTSLAPDTSSEVLIEGGNLVYRSSSPITAFPSRRLRPMLENLSTLAAAIERAR